MQIIVVLIQTLKILETTKKKILSHCGLFEVSKVVSGSHADCSAWRKERFDLFKQCQVRFLGKGKSCCCCQVTFLPSGLSSLFTFFHGEKEMIVLWVGILCTMYIKMLVIHMVRMT